MSDKALETFVPLSIHRWGHGRQLIDPERCWHNMPLLKAISLAFYWQDLLDTQVMPTTQAIARAEQLDAATVGRILRLSVLAPDLIECCLRGEQPYRMTVKRLVRARLSPHWPAQRAWVAALEEPPV